MKIKLGRILAVLLTVCLLAAALAGCSDNGSATASPSAEPTATPSAAPVTVNVGMLKGPTGIGAAYLMQQSEDGKSLGSYSFTTAAAPTDLVSRVVSGELDICALPTNVAASLYAKTGGGVQALALNTLGVLYILENGDSVQSVADLRGKTLYATGQGSNPEYVLNYLLAESGLQVGEDVTVEFRDSDELAALMASGGIDLCMLPVPAVTSVMMKNSATRVALDLTALWDETAESGTLTMGCVVVRRAFAEQNPEAVAAFLTDYEASVKYVTENVDAASQLVAKYEITGSAAVAAAAIPDCNIVFISGADIQPALEGYYQVLFAADPSSIGGAIPDADFYYIG